MGKYCFGVDVGGTTVKLGLFNTSGDLMEKWEIPTVTEDDGKAILPDCAKSILKKMDERKMDRTEVVGVGIGAPGPVDSEGTLYGAVNLGWGTMSLKKELQTLLNMPVEAGNDANVAALGEAWQGGAKGYEDVVVVTLGTGVGGGIIINGKMVAGATGAAGEIGHMHVNDDETEPCNCGNCGCLEEYVSATGIVRMAKRKLAKDDRPSIMRKDDLSAKDVWDAVKAGDTVATEVAEDFGCGGASSVYEQLLPYCDTAHVTKIDHAYEADAWFPNLDEDPDWEITADSDEQYYFDLTYHFLKYERKKG